MKMLKNLYFTCFVLSLGAANLQAMKRGSEEMLEENPAKKQKLFYDEDAKNATDLKPKVRIQKNFLIDNISKILEHLPQNGSTVVIFDYDDTISPSFTDNWCEENEENGTLATIKELHKRGIKTMVLTARLHGEALSSCGIEVDKWMSEKLHQTAWLDNGALATNELLEREIEGEKIVTINQICFSGGKHGKGKGLEFLIDNNYFKEPPANIFFIDDWGPCIESVENAFINRHENMFLFHYKMPRAS